MAGLFAGTRTISIRQHILAVAEALGGENAAGVAGIGIEIAIAALVVVTIGAVVLAVRRLETVELRGETA